ncbi:amylo-alpha-1,6-glucosidase [Actinokineospora iranica]|uniref:Glycogen debranching enzyme (Alpha-1,6-glucosidase) n=1 Tax=Actinokineospora iranica TaxID=1271860 RepID=A0A1G6Z3N0_9PSEU|nr:glycogen debranching N-terminal domain-containing protein [Actinokineospora iranica]SDD96873.1 Glycogen debranching enzyme (alpha-1,6-glucosidase) [Actinokineospora iranica]
MSSGWAFDGEPAALGNGTVTLVQGTSFCVCGGDGEMATDAAQGVFFRDTRVISTWHVRLNDRPVEPITTMTPNPFHATFLGRAHLDHDIGEASLLVHRDRYVGTGMREDIELRNLGQRTAEIWLSVEIGADFADLFEVKEGRVRSAGEYSIDVEAGEMRMRRRLRDQCRGVRISAHGAEARADRLLFRAIVGPRESWQTSILVHPTVDGVEWPALFPTERPVTESVPMVRAKQWRRSGPVVRWADNVGLARTLQRSRQDLGALRIVDPERPDEEVVAAGAPWFMTLFGRDSILASLMAMSVDPVLALGTLRTLARYQGSRTERHSEEQPGRIVHEMRFGADASLALGGSNAYYGTADATPLFVLLMGELHLWGIGRDHVEALLPHADRALDWVERHGDSDGDGFVEYERGTDRGLVNQGWKDSWDGVNFADGRIATAPIALCEVQAYVYGAYLARANMAEGVGDTERAGHWRERAAKLKQAFNERFWLPDKGWFALGLDRDKTPIDALTSNIGHCLWTGIVDADKAAAVADHLLSPAMFSGWGVRTLSADMGAYNPMSYHNGSVWPHDNAIVAAGLMRYGFVEHAQRVAAAIFDAAKEFGGRLPELMCGFDRAEYYRPVPYPTSCSPQAWASAAPVHLLRTLLRVEPHVPDGRVWIDPAVPASLGYFLIDDVPLGGSRVSLRVDTDGLHVHGLAKDIQVIRAPWLHTDPH